MNVKMHFEGKKKDKKDKKGQKEQKRTIGTKRAKKDKRAKKGQMGQKEQKRTKMPFWDIGYCLSDFYGRGLWHKSFNDASVCGFIKSVVVQSARNV